MYYGTWNHYGNNTIGYDSLHVFETKADRDAWNRDDPENKKMVVKASNPLARKFNSSVSDTHGFHYTYHYADGRTSQIVRDNGRQHEEVTEFPADPRNVSDEQIAKRAEELRTENEKEFGND